MERNPKMESTNLTSDDKADRNGKKRKNPKAEGNRVKLNWKLCCKVTGPRGLFELFNGITAAAGISALRAAASLGSRRVYLMESELSLYPEPFASFYFIPFFNSSRFLFLSGGAAAGPPSAGEEDGRKCSCPNGILKAFIIIFFFFLTWTVQRISALRKPI